MIRTFDIASGALRGQFDLAADADYIYTDQLGFTRDGRIVLLAGDIRENVEPMMQDGQRLMVHRSDSTPKIVEIDVHDSAKPTARATTIAIPKTLDPMPAALGPADVAFVDGYANDGGALALVVVSLQGRVRRAAIVTSAKRHSHVQLMHVASRRDRITFAGHFTGHAKPLEGRVETVDWCEAQHGVECFGEHEDPTLAPYAALIGTISR